MSEHAVDETCFETDEMGFFTPRCICGWVFGPVPDLCILVDVLMEHASAASESP